MTITAAADVSPAFGDAVRAALVGLGEGDTVVVDAGVLATEDATGAAAWRITLFLPNPVGASWNVDRTRALKREARRRVDHLAKERGETLQGVTSILVTTRDAPIEELAPDEGPEPAERINAGESDEDS